MSFEDFFPSKILMPSCPLSQTESLEQEAGLISREAAPGTVQKMADFTEDDEMIDGDDFYAILNVRKEVF